MLLKATSNKVIRGNGYEYSDSMMVWGCFAAVRPEHLDSNLLENVRATVHKL